MQLRNASRNHRPGRYSEYTGPTRAERPTFVHDDPSFDAEVATHCAFPSLDMNHPRPGPSEAWKVHRRLEAAAAKHPVVVIDCDQEESDQEEFESPGNNSGPRDIGDHDGEVEYHDSEALPTSPQCSPSTRVIPHRLILTIKDMSKLPRGSTEIEQHHGQHNTTTDRDGDTIMVSPAQRSMGRRDVPGRPRLTMSISRRPMSPVFFPQDADSSGQLRRPKTVSLGRRPSRAVVVDEEPLSSPEMVESPVEDNFLFKDIFKPYVDWPEPSYLNREPASDEDTLVTNLIQTHPNWPDLSDGVKYLIFYDLTQNGLSFVRACRMLSLKFEESKEMIDIITQERNKVMKANKRLAEANDFSDKDWLDRLLSKAHDEELLTESLTDDDIRRGKVFLGFMGLHDVAANLGHYQRLSMGEGLQDYDVPLNHFESDGFQELIPHFLVGCHDEVREIWKACRRRNESQPRAMSDGELHVRMDAPPGTVNPVLVERLDHIRFWQDLDAADIGREHLLHPDNFLVDLRDGRFLNALDGSVVTDEERERRRASQAREAVKTAAAEHQLPPLPASMQTPGGGDRFPLLDQVQRGECPIIRDGEDIGPDALQKIRRVMNPKVQTMHQTLPVLPASEKEASLPAAQEPMADVSGTHGHDRESQQSGILHVSQSSPPTDRPLVSRSEADSLTILEPDQRLELFIHGILNKYQDQLNVPARSTRGALRRRSQSLEMECEEEFFDSSTVQKKKKRVQFEDDSYGEDEAEKKKKSPDKRGQKNKGEHDTPRSREPHIRGAGSTSRRTFDETPTPTAPRKRRSVKYGDAFMVDHFELPNQPNHQGVGSNVILPQQDEIRRRPPNEGHAEDTGTAQLMRKTIIKSSIELDPADEYDSQSYHSKQNDRENLTGQFGAPDPTSRQPNTTNFRDGLNHLAAYDSVSSAPRGASGQEFQYTLSNDLGVRDAGRQGHKSTPIITHVPSRASTQEWAGLTDGDFRAVQSQSQSKDHSGRQISVQNRGPFVALSSPPAIRKLGNGAIQQNREPSLAEHNQLPTRVLNGNKFEQPPGNLIQAALAARLPIDQGIRQFVNAVTPSHEGSRVETPNSAFETLSLAPKVGRADGTRGYNDQQLNNPDKSDCEKAPKKPKPKNKSHSLAETVTGSEDSSKSQPFKRQSTTPIPLPTIPGMRNSALKSLPRVPDIRNPESYMPKGSHLDTSFSNVGSLPSIAPTVGMKSGAQEMMSEAQIRKMGGRRAELEIYKSRERAKSAAASSTRSSSSTSSSASAGCPSNGPGIQHNSSHGSVTSKMSDVSLARGIAAPGVEQPGLHCTTTKSPAPSQQTTGSNAYSATVHNGVLGVGSSPSLNSISGTPPQHSSLVTNRTSPRLSTASQSPGTAHASYGAHQIKSSQGIIPNFHNGSLQPQPSSAVSAAPSISQQHGSPGVTASTISGAKTSNPSLGSLIFGPPLITRVSPMSNLPGNFDHGQTSRYIQTQDESIHKAFNSAKQASFALRMPSEIHGNNSARGMRQGFVPGPTAGPNALLQKYHLSVIEQSQSGNTKRPRDLASKGSVAGASAVAARFQDMPVVSASRRMHDITAGQSRPSGTTAGVSSTSNRDLNAAPDLGSGQQIWSTTTANFKTGIQSKQGSESLEHPSQSSGFSHPTHQEKAHTPGQEQQVSANFPQRAVTIPVPSSEGPRAQLQTQPQGLIAGHYQASPRPISAPVAAPIVAGSAMSPPQVPQSGPTDMAVEPSFTQGSLIEISGVRRRPLGASGSHHDPNRYQGEGPHISQQGLPGIALPPSQFVGQGKGLGPANSLPTHNGMGARVTMGTGTGTDTGMGMDMTDMDSGMEDVAIDPRILGDMSDMSDMDFSS